ncbi:MAG: methylmalonyl Co-A mutase-associated GTPase MeaB [Acidimicrobiales bacterium]
MEPRERETATIPASQAGRRDPASLFEAARSGHRAALGRLLSLAERSGPAARQVSRLVFADGVARHVVGITGAPGAGKSTLTDRLIGVIRSEGSKVGVLAVDPSSPYSGGAILGDRIRMSGHATDDGVFIRSMATRGHLGGLALAAPEAVRVLAACGYPTILVETVGVGQVEVAVAAAADTTVVVVNPGWGDSVQAAKAGLLEVADVFVVNKADRPGAEQTRRDLESMLDLSAGAESGRRTASGAGRDVTKWRPPVLSTTAASPAGEGISELWEAIDAHRRHLEDTGELESRRRRRVLEEARSVLVAQIVSEIEAAERTEEFERLEAALAQREIDSYEAAAALRAALGVSPR